MCTFHLEEKKYGLGSLGEKVFVSPFVLGRSVESTPKLFGLADLDWQLAICALCSDNSQSKRGIT